MTWIDRACAIVAGATTFFVAFDADLPGRPIAALAFVLLVPGWTILRLANAPVTPLTGVAAVMLSISIAMIVSIVAIELLGWAWRPLAIGTAVACVVGLLTADIRAAIGGRGAIEGAPGHD